MSSVNSLSDLESFCNNYNENICTLKVNSNGIKYIRYKSDEYGWVISWLFYNPDNTFYKLISLSTTIWLSTADKNIVEYMVESLQFIK